MGEKYELREMKMVIKEIKEATQLLEKTLSKLEEESIIIEFNQLHIDMLEKFREIQIEDVLKSIEIYKKYNRDRNTSRLEKEIEVIKHLSYDDLFMRCLIEKLSQKVI